MNKTIIWKSLAHALGTAIYTALIAWFLFNGQHWLGNKPDNFLMPVLMLLLLVVSATITGLLVLAKPVMLYLSGAKKEALTFLFLTLSWLVIITLIVVIVLLAK
jgi:hypothetical protein